MKTTKITKATVKRYIKENADSLYINVKSDFNGMTDCVESLNGGFTKAIQTTDHLEHTLGVQGAWFVGQSRDNFNTWESETMTGIEIFNSCGCFILAIMKPVCERIENLKTIQNKEVENNFENGDLWNECETAIENLRMYGQETTPKCFEDEHGDGVVFENGEKVYFEGMTFENQK